jgi:hypothetical protein
VIALAIASLLAAPWSHPLAFKPLPGWHTGASGNVRSAYGGHGTPRASSAWIATNVRYRDRATADPPNATLRTLPRRGIIVWAVIYQDSTRLQPRIRLDFAKAKQFACCEGANVAGGEYELAGSGPESAYSVIVRIYFGSPPNRTRRSQAQRVLDRLRLPAPR